MPYAISLALEVVSNAKINHALLLFMIISSFDDVKTIFITTSMFIVKLMVCGLTW